MVFMLYIWTQSLCFIFVCFFGKFTKNPFKENGNIVFFSEYHLIPCTKAVLELSSASLQPWILSTTVKCIKINLSGIYPLQVIAIFPSQQSSSRSSGIYQSLSHCIISITVKCIKNQDQPNTQATGLFSSQSSYHYHPSGK